MKKSSSGIKAGRRGQSFVELSMTLLVLALILGGVVEYGFLLNAYLHVLDGAREAARQSSNSNPFELDSLTNQYNPADPNPYFYVVTAVEAATTMDPIKLQPSMNDDIVVSVFSESIIGSPEVVRFPAVYPNGWSMCQNFAQVTEYFNNLGGSVPRYLDAGWPGGCQPQQSAISNDIIQSRLDGAAPGTGLLSVEIYYHYSQVLKLPVVTSVIPDPIPVYTYTIMPLSAAEPTTTPIP